MGYAQLGRSIVKASFFICCKLRLMNKYWNNNRYLYIVFIDLEKTYDEVPRKMLRILSKPNNEKALEPNGQA